MNKIILDTFNSIIQKSKQSRLLHLFLKIYQASLTLGTLFGIYRGLKSWVKWILKRDRILITNKVLEPIVNTSVDTFYLGFYVLTTTFISALVVGTAPISVPIIVYTMKQKEDINQQQGNAQF